MHLVKIISKSESDQSDDQQKADMELADIIDNIHEAGDHLTIYAAEPWSCTSEAMLAIEPEEGGTPDDVVSKGLKYFLEVFVANEFLEDWLATVPGEVSAQKRCERLIKYAQDDA